MLNNPNEWHNIEEEIDDNQESVVVETLDANPKAFSKNKMQYIKIGLVVVAIVFIGLLAIGKKIQADKAEVAVNSQDPTQMGEYFYDKASGGAEEPTAVVDVNLGETQAPVPADTSIPVATIPPIAAAANDGAIVIESKQITPTDKYNYNKSINAPVASRETVIVSVGNEGRQNPFLPYKEKKKIPSGMAYSGYASPNFDIIEPPAALLPDPKATQLMETTISGIMFDYKNPSAIVNIDGQDQLVRRNDKLFGYTILDITRDKVVIKSGSNIYRASVGQSITTEGLNINDIANLKHKFAGSYRPVSRNSIEIKPN